MYDFIGNIKSLLTRNRDYSKAPPRKASDLLQLALDDLAKTEANPKFVIEMSEWVKPMSNHRCMVCFAGSVMACTLESDITKPTMPDGMPMPWINALRALDCFRQGRIDDAYHHLCRRVPAGVLGAIPITSYYPSPSIWRQEMNSLVKLLKKAGD